MSSANGSTRNGIRASSRMVTIVAWLTCWYMSMSDQRTGTGVANRSVTQWLPVPLVRVMLRI